MTRQRLPNRRACISFSFVCNDLDYTATVSYFADGRLAEIFLSNRRTNSHSDAAAKDSGVVCSIALQHGCRSRRSAKPCCVTLAAMHHRRWAWRSISSRGGHDRGRRAAGAPGRAQRRSLRDAGMRNARLALSRGDSIRRDMGTGMRARRDRTRAASRRSRGVCDRSHRLRIPRPRRTPCRFPDGIRGAGFHRLDRHQSAV